MWGRRSSTRRKRGPYRSPLRAAVRRARRKRLPQVRQQGKSAVRSHQSGSFRGGKNTARNLQLLFGPHNREKGVSRKYRVNPPPKQKGQSDRQGSRHLGRGRGMVRRPVRGPGA